MFQGADRLIRLICQVPPVRCLGRIAVLRGRWLENRGRTVGDLGKRLANCQTEVEDFLRKYLLHWGDWAGTLLGETAGLLEPHLKLTSTPPRHGSSNYW